jgi:hypothetical protein
MHSSLNTKVNNPPATKNPRLPLEIGSQVSGRFARKAMFVKDIPLAAFILNSVHSGIEWFGETAQRHWQIPSPPPWRCGNIRK